MEGLAPHHLGGNNEHNYCVQLSSIKQLMYRNYPEKFFWGAGQDSGEPVPSWPQPRTATGKRGGWLQPGKYWRSLEQGHSPVSLRLWLQMDLTADHRKKPKQTVKVPLWNSFKMLTNHGGQPAFERTLHSRVLLTVSKVCEESKVGRSRDTKIMSEVQRLFEETS